MDPQGNFQWVITAATPEGRLAHLGFTNIWAYGQHDPAYDQIKVYTITDRPVYRPGAPVRFKFWVARARATISPRRPISPARHFTVEIHNPKGEKIFTKEFTADKFGGFDGSFELPSDAALGVYQVFIPKRGGGSFRVEEYKKPEFEVNVDAPTKPVMLGEKVPATIKANYYFGGPVAQAKVKYKITRTTADERWYPVRALGLALRPGILVVRRRFRVVPRLVAPGACTARSPGGGANPRPRPKSSPRPSCRSGPTERFPSRSTPRLPRQVIPTTTIDTRSRPRSPTSRAARSSGREPCWSPANRSRSIPGSIAATTARATRSKPA